MGQFESEGIILKTYSLAEADKIVLILTEKYGLIRGIAKGAKRLKSKFGGNLEPFSVVFAEIYQKEERELVSIRNLELRKSYFTQASEPIILQKFAYLAELLAEFSPPHDPSERVYNMAKICFDTIEQQPSMIDPIVLYFEFWILNLGGYLPNWEKCDGCGNNLDGSDFSNLQMNFHLLCGQCRKGKSHQTVSENLREIFVGARSSSPVRFIERFGHHNELIIHLSSILKKIITHILNREVISQRAMISAS